MADTEWVPPSEIPELVYEADVVAIDLETHDPDIKTKGPGWATNNGKLLALQLQLMVGKDTFLQVMRKDLTLMKEYLKEILKRFQIKIT